MNEHLKRFKGTNCVAYGQSRDKRIESLVYDGLAFTRRQIEQTIFYNRKSSKRLAQYALSRLHKQERINKFVRAPQLPVIYYSRKLRNWDHALLINDVYCSLLAQKKSWYVIEWKWSYSILNGMVYADAMANIYLEPDRKERKVVFVEVERNPSKLFNKPEQYQKVYDADWVNEEWAVIKDRTAIFPTILVVTEDKLSIKSELNFIVASIEEVQKDIYRLLRR